MESDLFQNYQPQQNQQQPNSGLVRYRSAPSSYFSNLLERDIYDELMINRPSSPETERIFARFMSGSGAGAGNDLRRNTLVGEVGQQQPAFPTPEKPKVEIFQQNPKQEQEQNNFISASSSQNYYQALLPNQNMDYRVVNPMGSSSTSGLIRQSSSPAGLFLNKNLEGYGSLSSMVGGAGESSFSPTGRFGDHMNYLARQTSTGKMSPIAEMESKGLGKCSPEGGGGFAEGHGNNYDAGLPLGSWDDSVDGAFSGLHASEAEDGEGRTSAHPRLLAHHLSLPSPKTTAEMSAFLPLQDSIPCKIRAKRGCATHPRSIAERVRRTKISERIRKLQDLVPNMDKQTNTADMLDLAVDYIKELQDQVKALSDDRSRCVCPNNQPL